MKNEKKIRVSIFFFLNFLVAGNEKKKKRNENNNNNNKFGVENDLGYCPIVLQERHCIVI